ncbi:unnamed protein product [Cuscuta campestris]|uniref:Uncharacterized protein n=2 Tax=Cuscuta sect. Cleistogrammica TaxID=1824901 RepID=A0A484MMA2_9ASTE|nr:hypothetical protein DM860_003053 [Cuscuta australis]VFQ89619.1 unnamed protein product [Cuscuta campestris]
MKKLYRKSTVHPTPAPPPPPPSLSTRLAFLPAAILALLASLSEEDKQVLSYFLFCPSATLFNPHAFMKGRGGGGGAADHHPPSPSCYCFNCYRSFWARWDSSPDRRIIDEIVEAYEDGLHRKKERSRKKETRKIGKGPAVGLKSKDDSGAVPEMPGDSGGGGDGGAAERGSVRRFVGFLGERIWSVWT